MDYCAQITAIGDPDRMQKVMEAEEKSFARSAYTITKQQDRLIFDIKSKDPTALRATLNTITQFLVIYHALKYQMQTQKEKTKLQKEKTIEQKRFAKYKKRN